MNVVSKSQLYFLCLLLVLFITCGCNKIYEPVKIDRFDEQLFALNGVNSSQHFKQLSDQYKTFYKSYAEDMLNINETEAAVNYEPSLLKFINYPGIQQLKREVDSIYADLSSIESQLGEAMYNYHTFFPQTAQPKFISFISEFGYANVTYDSIIGIGLDMYLGDQYKLYHALEFPDFMIAKLRREYMIPNTIKSLAIGKYEYQLKDKRFLAMMLFEGKVRYFMKQLLPDIEDSILLGYNVKQLAWCKRNEQLIWTHFIEQKLLYSNDVGQYMRYFNDGPFTIATGVPQESAPAIAVFTGYMAISKFMKENKQITLAQLMENADWDELLKWSKYRP
ncbi:MAG: hypothetical protein H7296_06630 [Bacteroidia bacterium]|nr:hypothetical protein [Bacteroidia bacterium]